MTESTRFLESLQHDNPDRPRFTIKCGVHENLEIGSRGQVMCIPIAESPEFARRCEADQKSQRTAQVRVRVRVPGLLVHPYPIMSANLGDPDIRNLRWWPDP